MRILIFLSHPAQFLFFKNAIKVLKDNGHRIFLLIKTKDVLSDLVDDSGWEYINIVPKERGRSRLSILWSLLRRDFKITRFAAWNKIELLMGSDASLAHTGKLLGIPCITILEDDYVVIKNLARLTYPFTTHILVPEVCDVGKWNKKKIGYPGYMKLTYLHPLYFRRDQSRAGVDTNTPFFLIRLSGLSAHHDFGISGINKNLLEKIIELIRDRGDLFISSENSLSNIYEKFKLNIPVSDLHHCLSYASLLISDSQSMAMEAAMLGVPSIRISGFAGRISVLEELEHRYGLTFGFQPENEKDILQKINDLIQTPDLQNVFQQKRNRMLNEKIDVTSFLIWFIEKYPDSAFQMKKDAKFTDNFIQKELE